MTTTKIGLFRADHVGIFLRPDVLKKARKEYTEGFMTKKELSRIENEEILK